MKFLAPKTLTLIVSLASALGIATLVVQHFRHGWPFSLHHGIAVDPGTGHVTNLGAGSADSNGVVAHPRAEFELGQAEVDSIGVRLEKVQQELISEPIRAVATVVPDESRLSHVHTRVAGWIERLSVSTTGERVRLGQPIAGIFSQELLSSQTEYLAARRATTSGPRSVVVEGARSRLKVLGMTDAEIRAIEDAGAPRRLVTIAAPRDGVVLRRGISVGTAVDPSTEIVTIADLSRVWVLAEVSEGDIPSVQVGAVAELEFAASGREPFEAKVEFLYPTLTERTRTLRVRFVVDNPSGSLRPGIYGAVTFHVSPRTALTVPRDAIVDTGSEQHVFVAMGERRFAPRSIKLGKRLGQRVEVVDGLQSGELIVASGVFLIDSESRLRASGGGLAHAHGAAAREHSSHEAHALPSEKPGDPWPPATPTASASTTTLSSSGEDVHVHPGSNNHTGH